jgi:acyl carrier protein
MNDTELRDVVCGVLGEIAPEADLDHLDPSASFSDELDLDSINFLDFVSALHDRTGIDVPERDYSSITTLDDCISYLGARSAR